MGEKHLVVQGATCLCNFGTSTDKVKVLTHKREYANDNGAEKKLIASTKDIGSTLEKNSFGSCAKQKNNPCVAVITEWTGFYELDTLSNGGKVLLEDSKATCPIGGSGCIKIIKHGQTAEMGKGAAQKAKQEVQSALNPMVDMDDLLDELPAVE
ncbi:DUF4280 domain-containing protein [Pedobacter caeni]|uniref:DUF4280 domain-containing protein n=1 Tax=Pedobacter caeni TaxID=288992 RepID=A0A1M5PZN5_9SPHI|nr:DUF4280 domain-containing protein [Pedobacter caeni]SHH07208.1 protein of unknown function [Pedobacter caeni]